MRIILIIGLVLIFGKTFSQEQKVSISFEQSNRAQVLEQIQGLTDYQLYYVKDWLGDDLISGTYTDTSLKEILNEVFKETVINFYVLDKNKIVLTRNNRIYDELPEGFFGKVKDENVIAEEENESNPVFYKNEKKKNNTKIETIRIGKEDRRNRKKKYTLTGYVKNIRTDEPIADLPIIVKRKNTGVQTNKNGYYEIELSPGLNILETKSLGMEDVQKRVIIYNDGRFDFDLDESLEMLDVIVLESDFDKNVKDANTGTEKIDVEESKNIPLVLGERDVLKVATTLPGISTAGEGSTGFNVRGGKSDQNLILLDDAVIYNPQHFFGVFSAINSFTLGDVDIYKGSIPAEYGGRLSSVFDMRTKEGDTKEFKGEAAIGPVTSSLAIETPIVKDKASLIIGGRAAYANWILNSLDEESLNNSEASFYDANAKYTHKINDNNKITASGYFSRDDFSITSDSLFVYSNRLASLNWSHRFNDKNRGNLIVSNSQYTFDIKFDGVGNNDFDLGNSINETEVKAKLKYLHSDKLKFDYGLSSKLYALKPGSIEPKNSDSDITPLTIPKERALESAVFLSAKYDVNEKLLVDAGLRYSFYNALGASNQRIYQDGLPRNEATLIETQEFDDNEVIETYGNPEFRFAARYLLTPDFSIKASYNNTVQYIHRLSNNTTASPIDTWKLSDINIKPQRANQVSLGFYKNFDQNVFELSLEGFYKRTNDILDFKTGAEILLNETIETEVLQGEGKSYGVEFLIKKNKGKFNGWLGYTYSRSFVKLDSEFTEEQVNNGEFFPSNFDKPHDISMVANYKFTKRFNLSANFVYQTGRPVTFPVGSFVFNDSEFVVFSDRNKFRIPDFYRLDLGFNIEGNHKKNKVAHSFWTISVYNVLGRNNPYSVFFVTDNGEVKALQSSIFAIPVPSITYSFKF